MKERNRALVFAAIVVMIVSILGTVSTITPPQFAGASGRSVTKTTTQLATSISRVCNTPCPLWSREVAGDFVRLAISPDDSYVVAGTGHGSRSGAVYLFNKQGQPLWRRDLDRLVVSVAISYNGSVVAAAGSQRNVAADFVQNGSIYLFDRRGNLLWNLTTGGFPVLDVKVSTDGSTVVAITNQKILYFDKQGNFLWSYGTPTGALEALDSSDDASQIVASFGFLGNRPDVYSWSFVSFDGRGNVLWNYTAADGGEPGVIALSSNSSYFVGSSNVRDRNGTLYFFTKQGSLLWTHHISRALRIEPDRFGSNTLVYTTAGTLVFGQDGLLLRNFTVGPATNYRSSCAPTSFWARDPQGRIVAFLDPQGHTISTYLPRGIAPRAALSLDGYYAAVAVRQETGFSVVFLLLRQANADCSGR